MLPEANRLQRLVIPGYEQRKHEKTVVNRTHAGPFTNREHKLLVSAVLRL